MDRPDASVWRSRPHAPVPGTRLMQIADLPEPTAREVTFGPERGAFRMIVLHWRGMIRAYLNICPHFSLPLNYRPDNFLTPDTEYLLCSMHFALFQPEDGLCIEGACLGHYLDPIPIGLSSDGWIEISTEERL